MANFSARRGTFKSRVKAFPKESALQGAKFVTALSELFAALNATPAQVEAAWKSQVVALYGRIVAGTPVDTGRAKAAWRGPEFKSTSEGVHTAKIWNNVHYIIWLEYGWSRQAPQGMVRINLHRMSNEIMQTLRNLLKKRKRDVEGRG